MSCVGRATALKRGTVESNDVIPARKDKIANETFISVDDEISAKFFRFFVMSHEFRRMHGAKITTDRLYTAIRPRYRGCGVEVPTRTMIGTRPQSLMTERTVWPG